MISFINRERYETNRRNATNSLERNSKSIVKKKHESKAHVDLSPTEVIELTILILRHKAADRASGAASSHGRTLGVHHVHTERTMQLTIHFTARATAMKHFHDIFHGNHRQRSILHRFHDKDTMHTGGSELCDDHEQGSRWFHTHSREYSASASEGSSASHLSNEVHDRDMETLRRWGLKV